MSFHKNVRNSDGWHFPGIGDGCAVIVFFSANKTRVLPIIPIVSIGQAAYIERNGRRGSAFTGVAPQIKPSAFRNGARV